MTAHDHPELPGLSERTIARCVRSSVQSWGDARALTDADATYTYRELGQAVCSLASGLETLGVGHQSTVATILDNSADHALVWLTLGCVGAVGVPINPSLPVGYITDILASSGADVVVIESDYLGAELSEGIARLTPIPRIVVRSRSSDAGWSSRLDKTDLLDLFRTAAKKTLEQFAEETKPWDTQAIIFTSGTTGRPKGALVTQAQTYTRAAFLRLSASDRKVVSLVTLPLFHVAGQCRGLLGALLVGGEAVITERFSVRAFWADVDKYAVTHTTLLGSMARFLMKSPQPVHRRNSPQVTMYMAPAIPEIVEFEERFSVLGVSSYGSTEAGSIISGPARRLTSGSLHPEYDGRIVDDFDCDLPVGEAGELVVRSAVPWTLSPGYLDDPAATTALWRNGWFHTGDVFVAGEGGQLTFAGRKKDLIRRRGENINPAAVEEAIESHPDVVAAMAMPVSSEHIEDEVKVIVMRREGAQLDPVDLLAYLRGRLPSFAMPRFVEYRSRLPMTRSGKIDRAATQALPVGEVWDQSAASGC